MTHDGYAADDVEDILRNMQFQLFYFKEDGSRPHESTVWSTIW